MRKFELIKQSQLLKIKSQILSNLFNEKYGFKLGEFKNTTGTEGVNRGRKALVWGWRKNMLDRTKWKHTRLVLKPQVWYYWRIVAEPKHKYLKLKAQTLTLTQRLW